MKVQQGDTPGDVCYVILAMGTFNENKILHSVWRRVGCCVVFEETDEIVHVSCDSTHPTQRSCGVSTTAIKASMNDNN